MRLFDVYFWFSPVAQARFDSEPPDVTIKDVRAHTRHDAMIYAWRGLREVSANGSFVFGCWDTHEHKGKGPSNPY